MKKNKEIELRSEEVQEVMGQILAWIIRWGITVLFAVVLSLLLGSYFFQYPEVVTTEMVLTSRQPVGKVVARWAGKISGLYAANGQEVKMGALLAVVEIAFLDGLATNYGKLLPVSHEMKATAEIVTDDLRLIEHFFLPLKKIFKEGF